MRMQFLLATVLTALISPAAASAGEITIERGYLDIVNGSGALVLSGSRGFSFQARVSAGSGRFEPARCNADPLRCIPGATLDLYAAWSGGDLGGRATLDGMEYPSVNGGVPPYADMRVEFVGSVVLPPINSALAATGALFHLSGTFSHPAAESLTGDASVTVFLAASEAYPGSWRVTRVFYDFGVPLPFEWTSHDIGTADAVGSAVYTDGTFGISADGRDIWDTQDGFRFTAHRATNVMAVTARVREQRAVDHFAKAGVMLRQSHDPGAAHVILDLTPDGEIEFMTRSRRVAETRWIAGATALSEQPWLMLRRIGHTFHALQSADGLQWQEVATVVLPIATGLQGGLAVTSHVPGFYDFVLFDHVQVETAPTLTENLLTGGDFEIYEPPNLGPGWVSDDYRATAAISAAFSPHTGARNGRCFTRDLPDCGLYQEVTAPVTGAYTYRVFVAGDRPGGLVGANVNGRLAASIPIVDDAGYVGGAVNFSAAAGDVIRVWLYAPAGGGAYEIDDAFLTRVMDHDTFSSGTWTVESNPPPQARFAIDGVNTAIQGRWQSGYVAPEWLCRPCAPGSVVDLATVFENLTPLTIASAASGTATVDGQFYPFLEFGGVLTLTGGFATIPAPPGNDYPELVTVATPFVADGVLRGFEVLGLRDPRLVFERPFSGSGTAYLDLLSGPSPGGPVLTFYRLRYVFGADQ